MLDQKQSFQHVIAWTIHNLYNTYKEAAEVTADEKLTDVEKTLRLKGPHGTDYRLVNYLALLMPVIDQAEQEFPEHKEQFFTWARDRWEYIKSLKMIEGECQCKGCKKEEPVVS